MKPKSIASGRFASGLPFFLILLTRISFIDAVRGMKFDPPAFDADSAIKNSWTFGFVGLNEIVMAPVSSSQKNTL